MTSNNRNADVVVIGGGLHGCATALHLARSGLTVIVVEKDYVGRHASTANAGGVRRLGRALPEIPLAIEALAAWHHISDLVDDDCRFASSCHVKVAETEAELRSLRERRDTLLSLGFEHEEIIDQAQLRELLPAIAPHCIGGMVVHGDGHANPFLTVQAFKRKALALGVRFEEGNAVESLQKQGDTWQVGAQQGQLEHCVGYWTGAFVGQTPAAVDQC